MNAASPEQSERLPRVAIVQMASIAVSKYEAGLPNYEEVYGKLPRELGQEEVALLGSSISQLVASVVPYSDTEGYGRKSEISAIRRLGSAASAHGDGVTYESTREHLRNRGARGRAAAIALWWEKKLGLTR